MNSKRRREETGGWHGAGRGGRRTTLLYKAGSRHRKMNGAASWAGKNITSPFRTCTQMHKGSGTACSFHCHKQKQGAERPSASR